jgi:ABC-type phosphate transport system substrate-binding protein
VRRLSLIATFIALALVLQGGAPFAADAARGFQVVVHSDVQGNQIPREVLSSIFLKKAPRWGDGSLVSPVDQSLRSEVRAAFAKQVHGESLVGVQAYWHKRMSKGVAPPPVKSSDQEVLSFVAETPGSIGYVSPEASLPSGVRAIAVVD